MRQISTLMPGDSVELIAPASRCSDQELQDIKDLFLAWQLDCVVDPSIFGSDLLCANHDAARFKLLKNALQNKATKAIICVRGGYGCIRLIPKLMKMTPPATNKLFVGMSDITVLNLYLQQHWGWPVIHGGALPSKFSPDSIARLRSLLFNESPSLTIKAEPLNALAEESSIIKAPIIGGNLCLVQASIGTPWQINAYKKIIFLEEVNERGYKVDRMLEHLRQAHVFTGVSAILFGDFLEGKEPNGSSLIKPVLKRFAEECKVPVVQVEGIGHDYINRPILFGPSATLALGQNAQLTLC